MLSNVYLQQCVVFKKSDSLKKHSIGGCASRVTEKGYVDVITYRTEARLQNVKKPPEITFIEIKLPTLTQSHALF
jgi:hypothetical protein